LWIRSAREFGEMQGVSTLVSRFPQHELAFHRLWARDDRFREVCADYEAALAALRHWECLEAAPARAREYRTLVTELEEEIMEMVDARGCA
jgi:hypothetical protein